MKADFIEYAGPKHKGTEIPEKHSKIGDPNGYAHGWSGGKKCLSHQYGCIKSQVSHNPHNNQRIEGFRPSLHRRGKFGREKIDSDMLIMLQSNGAGHHDSKDSKISGNLLCPEKRFVEYIPKEYLKQSSCQYPQGR